MSKHGNHRYKWVKFTYKRYKLLDQKTKTKSDIRDIAKTKGHRKN